jgi:excisionase family DNA binding protein
VTDENGNSCLLHGLLERLEELEDSFLTGLQELRALRSELQKQADASPTLESLLDTEEVAKLLGVDVGYIYEQARANKMPSLKLGKYRKFSPSQLRKWLERKKSA